MKHSYTVHGMTCESCAEKVKTALETNSNISNAEVNFAKKEVLITMQNHIEIEELNVVLKPLQKYTLSLVTAPNELPEKSIKTYWPLILVVLYILGGTLHLGWVRGLYNLTMTEFTTGFSLTALMPDFMGLFFVGFAFFKLLDLKGFAESYRSYDIITKQWPTWGYIYPFVELLLGMLYLHQITPFWTNIATLMVMGLSIIGVIQSVLQKRKIKCACLGTGFNLPMSTVTIIEDGLMIVMALWMIFAL